MKYILLIGDGMADDPTEKLGGKTPLEVAEKPNMDRLAAEGELGSVNNCPAELPAGSDTANATPAGRRWRPRPRGSPCSRETWPTAATWPPWRKGTCPSTRGASSPIPPAASTGN